MSPDDFHLPSLARVDAFDALSRMRADGPVTASDREKAEGFIRDGQADIAKYEEETARLRRQMLHAERQKQRLDAQVVLFHSLLSPIHRLPNETLSNIFSYVPAKNVLDALTSRDSSGPLIPGEWMIPGRALQNVCSRWRGLALATPSLWSNIIVNLIDDSSYQSAMDLQAQVVAVLLKRSGRHPLSITVDFFNGGTWNHVHPTWNLLLSERSRWRNLSIINADYPEMSLASPHVEAAPLPLLEHVRFETTGDGCVDTGHIFDQAFRLSSVHLIGCYDVNLAFEQILTLQMDIGWIGDEGTATKALFNQLTSLSQLTLRLKYPADDEDEDEFDFDLPEICRSLIMDVAPLNQANSKSYQPILCNRDTFPHKSHGQVWPDFCQRKLATLLRVPGLSESIPMHAHLPVPSLCCFRVIDNHS